MFDDLILEMKIIRQSRTATLADLNRQILELSAKRDELGKPFDQQETDLLDEWRPRVLAYGKTYSGANGSVSYRKGRQTVTYDWRSVDVVKQSLEDIAPKLAHDLSMARKQSNGEPSFSVETS